jgi:ABC-type multidrug transport system fused ATPase/permease subunit
MVSKDLRFKYTAEPLCHAICFSNVTFYYPGSKSVKGALKGVSLSIKPGQLVIVVGANGSGKSTIVKILTRLYDVTSGEVLVDGRPIQDYNITDLHDATATLTQNNFIYPLSLAKNIGLGYPEFTEDAKMVEEAAKLGGSDEFIDNLSDGFNTTLDPVRTSHGSWLDLPRYQPLQDILNKLEMPVEISGYLLCFCFMEVLISIYQVARSNVSLRESSAQLIAHCS